MALQVASFCESLLAMNTFIRFRQLFDVFYHEGVPFINTHCQNVCQLGRQPSSEMPYNFTILSPLGLKHSDSNSIRKIRTLI